MAVEQRGNWWSMKYPDVLHYSVWGWNEVDGLKDIYKIKWIIFVNRLDVEAN